MRKVDVPSGDRVNATGVGGIASRRLPGRARCRYRAPRLRDSGVPGDEDAAFARTGAAASRAVEGLASSSTGGAAGTRLDGRLKLALQPAPESWNRSNADGRQLLERIDESF